MNVVLGSTAVERGRLEARQACLASQFQHWARCFALSFTSLIREDHRRVITGFWKRGWSYVGSVFNLGPGMYLKLPYP